MTCGESEDCPKGALCQYHRVILLILRPAHTVRYVRILLLRLDPAHLEFDMRIYRCAFTWDEMTSYGWRMLLLHLSLNYHYWLGSCHGANHG